MNQQNKKGKRYSPKLKFEAAIEAIKGKDLGQIAKYYGVHPTSIGHWRDQLMEKGPELFSHQSATASYEKRIVQLEQLVGKKELEIAFLKNFLGQTN